MWSLRSKRRDDKIFTSGLADEWLNSDEGRKSGLDAEHGGERPFPSEGCSMNGTWFSESTPIVNRGVSRCCCSSDQFSSESTSIVDKGASEEHYYSSGRFSSDSAELRRVEDSNLHKAVCKGRSFFLREKVHLIMWNKVIQNLERHQWLEWVSRQIGLIFDELEMVKPKSLVLVVGHKRNSI